MSAETTQWLNTMTLIGQTIKRGKAWHYREASQGSESNHYEGFIPVADVKRRLFAWEVAEGNVCSRVTGADGTSYVIKDENRKAMVRPPGSLGTDDPGGILGVFKSGYQGHGYSDWLISEVSAILDTDLGISSAGLLAMGAQAWVEVSVPDTIRTPEGVTFRPNLLCTTSYDGTLATTYKRSVNDTVCDNTRAITLGSEGEVFRVKHTRNSGLKLLEAREALAMIHTIADDFAAEVKALCETTVTDAQWSAFLDEICPLHVKGEAIEGRSLTMATKKRDEIGALWANDNRVEPWKNTAHGVMQAVNTWATHVQSFKGGDRAGRNMTLMVTGGFDKVDADTAASLNKVLALA